MIASLTGKLTLLGKSERRKMEVDFEDEREKMIREMKKNNK